MPVNLPFLGETLALLSALFWALAVILFKKSGETVHPLGLNLFKNMVALTLLIPTLVIFHTPLLPRMSSGDYLKFIISGLLGMTLGDTLFFMSLNRLGANLAAITSYTYSPILVIFSLLFLKERILPLQTLGIVMILTALLLISSSRTSKQISRRNLLTGITLGIFSTACTAVGVIIIKPLLAQTPLLWAAALRLLIGMAGVAIVILVLPERRKIIASIFKLQGLGYSTAGTVLGTYLALTVWLGGMKFTQVSVAAPLNQLSNIFIFIFSALFLREPVTRTRLLAIITAGIGATLVFIKQ
ncbi:MAG: DMT family transporter [candidate division WOR-3 bacterium]|uniref:DMT family transporter n=1 Tax=candidate division WOR-3 bacterium TaxID=2052148 RepID=A0A7C3IXN0_UNCW3|nr:DMT family transporter [candidate division WOR-3 bacterium]